MNNNTAKRLIKVCGMKSKENLASLLKLDIDLVGVIFYPPSPRYAGNIPAEELVVPVNIQKVGVFVNASPTQIAETVQRHHLTAIQLHGNESITSIQAIKRELPEVTLIKAFGIEKESDFSSIPQYENIVDYALLDTKTSQLGGSGRKFDWNIIHSYKSHLPFFLSGGISVDDAEKINRIHHPKFHGVDINSRFEVSPGIKNITEISNFITLIRNNE